MEKIKYLFRCSLKNEEVSNKDLLLVMEVLIRDGKVIDGRRQGTIYHQEKRTETSTHGGVYGGKNMGTSYEVARWGREL